MGGGRLTAGLRLYRADGKDDERRDAEPATAEESEADSTKGPSLAAWDKNEIPEEELMRFIALFRNTAASCVAVSFQSHFEGPLHGVSRICVPKR